MIRPIVLVSMIFAAVAALTSASDSSVAQVATSSSTSGNSSVPAGSGGTPPSGSVGGMGSAGGAPPSGSVGGGGAVPGGSTSTSSAVLSGAYTVSGDSQTTQSASKLAVTSTTVDQSAFFATNASVFTVSSSSFSKLEGDTTSNDNSNFYGQNAAFLVNNGSQVTLNKVKITSTTEGSNAVFSTGTDTIVHVNDLVVNTTASSSRGLDATMGGAIYAKNVKITTKGAHCGALATDRGEGTVYVQKATLSTAGEGSPCIYSTGNITCIQCTGHATGSEAAVIEGKNSITILDTQLSGALKHGVMLYQSMSGDASVGTATFTATRSTITNAVSPVFYITNTQALIELNNVQFKQPTDGDLLHANEDWWGTQGENGGHVTLKATKQVLKGDIVVDNVSSLVMNLTQSSKYTGAINTANNATSISLSLDKSSKWVVTKTSNVTTLTSADTKLKNIADNGHTIYYATASNSWLQGKTVSLSGGGKLVPY